MLLPCVKHWSPRVVGMVGSIAAGLVAALVAGGPAAACPSDGGLPCGSVISADTTLRADVTCTPEQQAAGLAALTVTASPVVLDLGGHTVRGNIRVNGNYSEDADVTIRSGTALRITAWEIRGLGVTRVRLAGMTIHASRARTPRPLWPNATATWPIEQMPPSTSTS